MTVNARRREIPYSLMLRFASEKAFERKSISMTAVVNINDKIPAQISQGFWVFILNIEPFKDRIFRAWNISAIERVKKAIEVPIISGE